MIKFTFFKIYLFSLFIFNISLVLVGCDTIAVNLLLPGGIHIIFFIFNMVWGLAFSWTDTGAIHLISQFCIILYLSQSQRPFRSCIFADLGPS